MWINSKFRVLAFTPLGLCRGMSAARTRSEDQRPLSKYLKDQCGSQDTRELVDLMQGVF